MSKSSSLSWTCQKIKLIVASYESLPPNYSLAANMTAGAFAGIAVRHDKAHWARPHADIK